MAPEIFEDYKVTFPGAEPGAVGSFKDKRLRNAIRQGLAKIVETNMDGREVTVCVKSKQVIYGALKNYRGKVTIEKIDKSGSVTPTLSVSDAKSLQRQNKYLAEELQKAQDWNSDLEVHTQDLEQQNSALKEEVQAIETQGIAGIASVYLQKQASDFFDTASVFEKHANKGTLDALLKCSGKTFLDYANEALAKEGAAPYRTELEMQKNLEKAKAPFESSEENKRLISDYKKAKEELDFLAKAKAGEIKNIPQEALQSLVKTYERKKAKNEKIVSKFDEQEALHKKKQTLKARLADLQPDYDRSRSEINKITEQCSAFTPSYAIVQSDSAKVIVLPFASKHSQMWLSSQLTNHVFDALGGTGLQPDAIKIDPIYQIPIPEKLSLKEVKGRLERALQNHDFAKFGIKPEVLMIEQSALEYQEIPDMELTPISEIAKRTKKTLAWVNAKLKQAADEGKIDLITEPHGKRVRLFVPTTQKGKAVKLVGKKKK